VPAGDSEAVVVDLKRPAGRPIAELCSRIRTLGARGTKSRFAFFDAAFFVLSMESDRNQRRRAWVSPQAVLSFRVPFSPRNLKFNRQHVIAENPDGVWFRFVAIGRNDSAEKEKAKQRTMPAMQPRHPMGSCGRVSSRLPLFSPGCVPSIRLPGEVLFF